MLGSAFTVSVSRAVPVPPAFVAPSETEETPATVRVPEITPVDGLMLRPDGRPFAA
jgi:hypothetical protein